MEFINKIKKTYVKQIENLDYLNLTNLEDLKIGINLSKKTLYQLCILIQKESYFLCPEDEILFFKRTKPFIFGRLKFFIEVHNYQLERPKVDIRKQKKYLRDALSNLESQKKKNLYFWRYVRHKQTAFDNIYFLRSNSQLELNFDDSDYFLNPNFSTNHDNLMSQVVAFDLLTDYYKNTLSKLETNGIEQSEQSMLTNLFWSGSKTDLIELIYALHASKVISNGHIEISKITQALEKTFNIKLGSPYKVYAEIKGRANLQTKFINKLKRNLVKKIKLEDEQF
ncbi:MULTISPECIES: RteC domain-containing protein [Bizionia]|uniref:Tetracycline regulation of excision, RteC n=1 Tax=Bizionia algoritergicola TaxID=291187 RepID=A0A5D0QU80_9FLAO|nr:MULTISPECIES: RteC domain-containing protein [Bizionia]OBX22029.1 hypothetical protein BAA08_10135 [Bizionia sp. APA-3]TYB71988.1 hypothetical protein ES675_12535 [Bizionia algoritergicola]